jgi:hypothetical protein
MNPSNRIKRHVQLASLGAVLACGLLCYFILLAPKFSRMADLQEKTVAADKELAECRREIENAEIAGPPIEGISRFEKFGILAIDEEELFLSDLIDFCKETNNTLELVRRSGVARTVSSEPPEPQSGAGAKKASGSSSSTPEVPRPAITRVPHTVSYSGSFLSSFFLLRRLESYKRLLTVERMEIATDHEVGYPKVKGTITIDLYLVKPPVEAPTQQASGQTGDGQPAAG